MSALVCYCGKQEFANRRCWIHLPSEIRNVYVLGRRLSAPEVAEVPEAFLKAFLNYNGRAAMATTISVPHRATIWLQDMANIQAKLRNPKLSQVRRRNLEHQLERLKRKLDQN